MSRLNKAKAQRYKCEDGPFKGHDLILTTNSTARFKYKEQVGYYQVDTKSGYPPVSCTYQEIKK